MKKYLLLYHQWGSKEVCVNQYAVMIIESNAENIETEISKATSDVNLKERGRLEKSFILQQIMPLE